MPDHEIDDIGREFATFLRTALQVAARLAEQRARDREQKMRNAEAQSQSAAREYTQRLASERASAEAQLQQVWSENWWDKTDRQSVADNYLLAKAWSESSPRAQEAARLIEREVEARYDIDPTTLTKPPRSDQDRVAETIAAADRADRDQADRDRDLDNSSAAQEPAVPTVAEPVAAAAGYDSPDRRAADADRLAGAGVDRDVIDVRMRADLDQGKPATAAVGSTGRTPRARKGRPVGGRDAERTRSGR